MRKLPPRPVSPRPYYGPHASKPAHPPGDPTVDAYEAACNLTLLAVLTQVGGAVTPARLAELVEAKRHAAATLRAAYPGHGLPNTPEVTEIRAGIRQSLLAIATRPHRNA